MENIEDPTPEEADLGLEEIGTLRRPQRRSPRKMEIVEKVKKEVKLPRRKLSQAQVYKLLINDAIQQKRHVLIEELDNPSILTQELWALLNAVESNKNYPQRYRKTFENLLHPGALHTLIYESSAIHPSKSLYLAILRAKEFSGEDLRDLRNKIRLHPNWKEPDTSSELMRGWIELYGKHSPSPGKLDPARSTNQLQYLIENSNLSAAEINAIYESLLNKREDVIPEDYQTLKGYRISETKFYKAAFQKVPFKRGKDIVDTIKSLDLSKRDLKKLEATCVSTRKQSQ